MKFQSFPHKKENYHVEEVDDGLVLHNPSDGSVHLLNLTASFIWEHCDGKHSPSDIAQSLAEISSLAEAKALKDVNETLHVFQESRLLQ